MTLPLNHKPSTAVMWQEPSEEASAVWLRRTAGSGAGTLRENIWHGRPILKPLLETEVHGAPGCTCMYSIYVRLCVSWLYNVSTDFYTVYA